MPMPHSGPRASPPTENRHGSPAIIIAAATLVPDTTRIGLPFTVIGQLSPINRTFSLVNFPAFLCEPRGSFHYYGRSPRTGKESSAVTLLALHETFTCKQVPAWMKIELNTFSKQD
jgi:hypothetical protein